MALPWHAAAVCQTFLECMALRVRACVHVCVCARQGMYNRLGLLCFLPM